MQYIHKLFTMPTSPVEDIELNEQTFQRGIGRVVSSRVQILPTAGQPCCCMPWPAITLDTCPAIEVGRGRKVGE